jgi:parvulin-like peptidyl-prolyl isomerase
MTTTIYMDSREYADTQQLVKSAIDGEIARLELALALARQRLAPFEEKYGVTSEQFIDTMAAEDLEGRDDEYVQWAGEYRLWQRLQQKLNQLRGIEYRDSNLLRLH